MVFTLLISVQRLFPLLILPQARLYHLECGKLTSCTILYGASKRALGEPWLVRSYDEIFEAESRFVADDSAIAD